MAVLSEVAWPPEPLATARLVLRQTQASDRSSYIEMLCSDDVRRFLGGAHAREVVEQAMPEVPGAYPGVFTVDLGGHCIGAVIVERRGDDRPGHVQSAGNELEVSYTFLPAYWRQGFASEAVAAALAWTWASFPASPCCCVRRSPTNAPWLSRGVSDSRKRRDSSNTEPNSGSASGGQPARLAAETRTPAWASVRE
jgi:hypothetical protein